jgi:hypothetical protein
MLAIEVECGTLCGHRPGDVVSLGAVPSSNQAKGFGYPDSKSGHRGEAATPRLARGGGISTRRAISHGAVAMDLPGWTMVGPQLLRLMLEITSGWLGSVKVSAGVSGFGNRMGEAGVLGMVREPPREFGSREEEDWVKMQCILEDGAGSWAPSKLEAAPPRTPSPRCPS